MRCQAYQTSISSTLQPWTKPNIIKSRKPLQQQTRLDSLKLMYEIIGIFNLKNLKQEFNTFFQTSIFLKYSIQQTSQYLMVEVMASFPDYALQLGSPNLHISWPVDSPQPVVLSDYSYLEDIGSICLSSDNVVIQICINNIIQSIHTPPLYNAPNFTLSKTITTFMSSRIVHCIPSATCSMEQVEGVTYKVQSGSCCPILFFIVTK